MLLWSLLVIFDWVTLLAPSSVLEGDSVVLKCQAKWTGGIKTMSYHKDGRQLLSSNKVSTFSIQSAAFNDSGQYHCAISGKLLWNRETTSKAVKLKVQELFPPPVLTASSSQPTEGTPVTLTCETWLPPEKSGTELQFCFFREGQGLGPGWSKSPELHIPTIWSQDSGSYWCEAQTVTPRVKKQSLKSQIHVQRVPVANVSLETQPPGGQVIEGEKLVLLCSVSEGTGNITFSWHRETTETSLGNKTQRSLSAELEILAVKDSDAGKYYCRADNGYRPVLSEVNITVRIPVSRPALTIRVSGAPAMVGDVVELHCEVQRGTHPILYQFYQKDVILGNSSASFGGGASFNLSLTSEHSENYSCEADNGLRAQRSEVVTLNVTGPEGYRKDLVIAGTLGGLFGVLGFVAVALPFYYWYQETSGGSSASNVPRGPSSSGSQESTHSSPLPAVGELQPLYANCETIYSNTLTVTEKGQPDYANDGAADKDVVYSQVWSIQQTEGAANTRGTFPETKDSSVTYANVRKT
ncbi:Fc receptor-like protein 2 isoform X11 [Loxodonta africana]|uniref:Fc receptor-like protein 2 isoform X3 n=1 Tax=Loxodonta africana TaxID=9785 RepID=UPI0030D5FDA1